MGRKNIGVLLIISMVLSGLPLTHVSYAAERDDLLIETFETEPVSEGEQEDATVRSDVVSETYMTTPVSEGEGDEDSDRPEGVVSMTLKTTAVDEEDEKDNSTEEQNVTGSSSMPDPSELGMYDEDVINMVMPVIPDETYNFIMDSDDLLSRFSLYKETYKKSSLYFTNSGDRVSHSGVSDVAMAKNKSSVPVLLYVTLQVENEFGWPVRYTDMDSVEEDEEKNISFALIPVSANGIEGVDADVAEAEEDTEQAEEESEPVSGDALIDDEDGESLVEADGSDTEESTESEEVAEAEEVNEQQDGFKFFNKKISIDETGKAEMILYLDGTKDNFDMIGDKYMAREDAVWSSLGFAVTGACNTKADWSEIDDRSDAGENIKIHISYHMDTLSEEQQAQIDEGLRPDPDTGVIVFD